MPERSTSSRGPGEPRKKFLLRVDPALWAELERWAAQELRSINGQIEFLLRRAVSERLRKPGRRAGEGAD